MSALPVRRGSRWNNPAHGQRTPARAGLGRTGDPLRLSDEIVTDDDYWSSLPHVLPIRELAPALRVHRDTVLRRIQDGTIPAHRIGRSWIVFTTELRAWLLTRRNQPMEADFDADPLAGWPDELTSADLIELFGKTKQTISAWLNSGEIPGYRIGGRWIVHKHELRTRLQETSNQPAGGVSRP